VPKKCLLWLLMMLILMMFYRFLGPVSVSLDFPLPWRPCCQPQHCWGCDFALRLASI
jgi:hypothetical protein